MCQNCQPNLVDKPAAKAAPIEQWRAQAAATGACLVVLLAALGADAAGAPTTASVLMGLSLVVGMLLPLRETLGNLARLRVDIDSLMLLVAVGAWALGHGAEGAFLLVLFGASRAMESYANRRTENAVASLLAELPPTAHRLDAEGRETEVPLDQLVAGDRVRVRPGERVPIDGRVVAGRASGDLAALTGESEPIVLEAGVEVPSGAINTDGVIEVEVLRPATESAFQKIVTLLRNAPARQSPAQVLSERVGRVYTAVLLAGVAVAFGVWWSVMGLPLHDALYRTMALLVAGSPCALVLSIPSAVLAGIAAGARRGVLFNGGRGLLAVAGVRAVAFDKTGTLTTGQPTVWQRSGERAEDTELLGVAGALASLSNHPASRAVRGHIAAKNLDTTAELSDVREIPGTGIEATWRGRRVLLGRMPFVEEGAVNAGPSVALVLDGRPVVRFWIREQVRPEAAPALAQLTAARLTTMILSGDNTAAVRALADRLGIAEAHGNLTPEGKVALLCNHGRHRGAMMMVGDGINDAPALAAAQVGVAMGLRASAATVAQADLILAHDRLDDLPGAIALGRRARSVIRQNIAISVGMAALLVIAALGAHLPLVLGVLGHEGGTVLVVLNSLRLLLSSDRAATSPPPSCGVPVRAGGSLQPTSA